MKYLYLIFCLFISCACFSQRQNVYFLKNDGRLVDLKDSADFIRVVREPDSGSVLYNVLEYYPKGAKKMLAKSSKIDPILSLEGTCISYYENGNRKEVVNYEKNIRVGDEYTYFPNGKLYTAKNFSAPDLSQPDALEKPQIVLIKAVKDSTGKDLVTDGNGRYPVFNYNYKHVLEEGDIKDGRRNGEWKGNAENGKLKFTEIYEDGKLISGSAVDSGGTYTYKQRMIPPRYKDGMGAFYNFLSSRVHYPDDDRRKGIQGTVLLNFLVAKNGMVKNIKVIRKVSPAIDAEAVHVLSMSKGWSAAVAYGRQVDQVFTVPIKLSLDY